MSTAARTDSGRVWQWVWMGAAIALVIAATIMFVRHSPVTQADDSAAGQSPKRTIAALLEVRRPVPRGRIMARIYSAADDQALRGEVELPMAGFVLTPGTTLAPGVAMNDGVKIVLSVPVRDHDHDAIMPGMATSPTIVPGARFAGGSLYVRRAGAEQAMITDVAQPGEVRTAWANRDRSLQGSAAHTVAYEFDWDGRDAAQWRALWRRGDDQAPALPVTGDFDLSLNGAAPDGYARGLHLARTRRCLACHETDHDVLRDLLAIPRAPDLTRAGDRLRQSWIQKWLVDPHAMQPASHMPDVFAGGTSEQAAEWIEDIAAYLSREEPAAEVYEDASREQASVGQALFNEVGCASCHGASGQPADKSLWTLAEVGAKYRGAGALSDFLIDPLAVHPDGRMPGMRLTVDEAAALAAYLVDGAPAQEAQVPANQRVATGEMIYSAMRCNACHEERSTGMAALPSLETVARSVVEAGDRTGVCSDVPEIGTPWFGFDEEDLGALRGFFRTMVGDDQLYASTASLLATDIARLNCAACHSIGEELGPGAQDMSLFASSEDADLGDEGRIPPTLTDVGGRLNRTWIATMLGGETVSRPWMKTRMPDFGAANVGDMPGLLCAVSGVGTDVDDGAHVFRMNGAAAVGREIVGINGLNCIECHSVAGRAATGTPGPDLALAAERLRYEAFVRWLWNPAQVRPGTRMPTFFYEDPTGGRVSPLRDFYGGNARKQIDAIWAYVSQGEDLALPEGLTSPTGTVIEVDEEPVVFRTFMEGAGVRAIAAGYPEGVHAAFDADRCATAVVWSGAFLDASAAWVNRGGSETNPTDVSWALDGDDAVMQPVMSIVGASGETLAAFGGYRLDAARRPVFMYVLRGGNMSVHVTEQPLPQSDGTMRIRYQFDGRPAAQIALGLRGRSVVDGSEHEVANGRVVMTLDEKGQGRVMLEVPR